MPFNHEETPDHLPAPANDCIEMIANHDEPVYHYPETAYHHPEINKTWSWAISE